MKNKDNKMYYVITGCDYLYNCCSCETGTCGCPGCSHCNSCEFCLTYPFTGWETEEELSQCDNGIHRVYC